jgi:hypothetical protein
MRAYIDQNPRSNGCNIAKKSLTSSWLPCPGNGALVQILDHLSLFHWLWMWHYQCNHHCLGKADVAAFSDEPGLFSYYIWQTFGICWYLPRRGNGVLVQTLGHLLCFPWTVSKCDARRNHECSDLFSLTTYLSGKHRCHFLLANFSHKTRQTVRPPFCREVVASRGSSCWVQL